MTTIIIPSLHELPDGHRPTRVYTISVDHASRLNRHGQWIARAIVRERFDVYESGIVVSSRVGGTADDARRHAARNTVRRMLQMLSDDLASDEQVPPTSQIPVVRFDVVYE